MTSERSLWPILGPIIGFVLLYMVVTQAADYLQHGQLAIKLDKEAAVTATAQAVADAIATAAPPAAAPAGSPHQRLQPPR